MFNLFRSRDKAVRLLLSGLLLVVALSMVAYLIPGSSDYSSPASTEAVLAEVGGAEITAREVQHALLGAQRGRELTPSMMRHFVPQLIEQLITERAVEYQATRLGFEVSKQDTANAIQRELPYLFQNGVFVGKEAYAAALAQQNLTIAEFENYMSRQILLNRMRNVVLEAVVVSNVEIEQEFRRRNEKAVVEYVKVEAEKIRPTIQPTMEELKEYFQRNRQGFMIGERRTFTLVILDPAKRGASVTVTDAEVRRAYEENKDRYRIPERVKSRHILLSTAGKPEAEIAKVQAKANDLLKQIKGGTDFAELAKKNSEDTATAPGGGELGWVERGRTVAEFETTLYALKPNEVSNVVKTQYGFHIIQAQGREEARLKPFDEVKAELEGEVKRQKASYGMQAAVDEALSGLRKDPAQAEALAKKLDLQVVKADKLAPTDPVPEIGSNPEYYA
ncbi:MAG: peptidylprolyl isomerase, partial [Bryobacteraceae bacterium]